MNRKGNDKESSGNAGPEHVGKPTGAHPGGYLEYENIPDPISFEDTPPARVQHANHANPQKRTGNDNRKERS